MECAKVKNDDNQAIISKESFGPHHGQQSQNKLIRAMKGIRHNENCKV
jgi:hypothetical protein